MSKFTMWMLQVSIACFDMLLQYLSGYHFFCNLSLFFFFRIEITLAGLFTLKGDFIVYCKGGRKAGGGLGSLSFPKSTKGA